MTEKDSARDSLGDDERREILRQLSEHFRSGGATPRGPVVTGSRLQGDYGDDKIAAMVRDPEWIFLYWELKGPKSREVFDRVGDGTLKIHIEDVTSRRYFTVEPEGELGNWYLKVVPQRSFAAAIGIEDSDGVFHQIAQTKTVRTPPNALSDEIDPEWMSVEWDEILRLSGVNIELRRKTSLVGTSGDVPRENQWTFTNPPRGVSSFGVTVRAETAPSRRAERLKPNES